MRFCLAECCDFLEWTPTWAAFHLATWSDVPVPVDKQIVIIDATSLNNSELVTRCSAIRMMRVSLSSIVEPHLNAERCNAIQCSSKVYLNNLDDTRNFYEHNLFLKRLCNVLIFLEPRFPWQHFRTNRHNTCKSSLAFLPFLSFTLSSFLLFFSSPSKSGLMLGVSLVMRDSLLLELEQTERHEKKNVDREGKGGKLEKLGT